VVLVSQFFIKQVNPVEFALFLHLGTLLAVLIYFFKDWKNLLFLKDLKLLRFLIIATLVSAIVGFLLYSLVINIVVGAGLLFLTGFGLLITAYFHKKKKHLEIKEDWLAVIVGLLQGLAVIPGVSRSGATIFGLSVKKDNPKEILTISYLMSAPVVLGSGLLVYFKNPKPLLEAWPALLVSFFVGLISLKILLRISQKINFFKFALIFSLLCFIGAFMLL